MRMYVRNLYYDGLVYQILVLIIYCIKLKTAM